MKRVLIYGGTTEGRRLAEKLTEAGIPSLVLVATEYGEQMMAPGEKSGRIQVLQGRLTAAEMAALYEREQPAVIVDATHPYAEAVKKNIRESREGFRQIPYYRVCRNPEVPEEREDARYFDSTADCVRALRSAAGNILLTTGSKTLSEFCRWPDLRERLYVRVLPSVESLEICGEQGIRGDRIIRHAGALLRGNESTDAAGDPFRNPGDEGKRPNRRRSRSNSGGGEGGGDVLYHSPASCRRGRTFLGAGVLGNSRTVPIGRYFPGGGGRRVRQNPIEGGAGGHRHERRTPSHAGGPAGAGPGRRCFSGRPACWNPLPKITKSIPSIRGTASCRFFRSFRRRLGKSRFVRESSFPGIRDSTAAAATWFPH